MLESSQRKGGAWSIDLYQSSDWDTGNVLSDEVKTHFQDGDFYGGKKRVDSEQAKEDEVGNESEDDLDELRRPERWKAVYVP